jgi:prepilin-type N-terminal cleavage/methylation domain-containing protein
MFRSKNGGFTLIELSIVMVIIGLLIGGILVGQSLIEAANARSLVNQISSYRSALTIFSSKYGYNAIPGDFNNASSFIVGANNGDGNGIFGYMDGSLDTPVACGGTGTTTGSIEYGNFWYQLATLGLIPGTYVNLSGINPQTVGTNMPRINMFPSLGIFAYGSNQANKNYFQVGYTNSGSTSSHFPSQNFLSPNIALSVDSKIDDGNPIAGKIVARGVIGGFLEGVPTITGSATLNRKFNFMFSWSYLWHGPKFL